MFPALLALSLSLPTAFANNTGKTGVSTSGCTTCHGASADSTTTTTILSSATSVTPGTVVTITVTVATTSGSRTHAGFNASVVDSSGANAGTLGAGTGSKVSSSEATHTGRRAMSGGSTSFTFTWTAPATAGTYTVRGVGNAVNNNSASSGDGWRLGTSVSIAVCADADGDGVLACAGDCNDSSSAIRPGASELPGDNVDQDCNGSETCYTDADNDGFATATTLVSSDADCNDVGEAVATDPRTDCSDGNAAIFPGAVERCDSLDNDCDALTDDADSGLTGGTSYYPDGDSDGFGLTSGLLSRCAAPPGYVTVGGDCNDASGTIRPGATETCDGVDQDCDGAIDDGAVGGSSWYPDLDGDGFGDPAASITSCTTPPSGYIAAAGDCDDTRVAINPDGTEVCDRLDLDEDCNGVSDDFDAGTDSSTATDWYGDADGDSFGGAFLGRTCEAPSGAVSTTGDCDDSDNSRFPAAAESCTDAVDLNCDGVVSRVDLDGDGLAACEECDDTDRDVFPGAVEVCNDKDDDCDGVVDGELATDAATFYIDADEDSYGDPGAPVQSCSATEGLVSDSSDCDDGDPAVNPGATELWYDGTDQDCDANDDDQDGDGVPSPEDCDDTDAALTDDCGDEGGDGATDGTTDGSADGSADGGDGAADGAADGADGAADGGVSDEDGATKDEGGCSSAPRAAGLMAVLMGLALSFRRRR